MNYNFDKLVPRRNTNSVKWDSAKYDDVIPMWVADMDFQTAPEIIEVISDKISHGVFGYSIIPANFHQVIIDWWKDNYQFTIEKEWLLTTPGISLSLSAIIRTFVNLGENIIVQPPVYNHFFTLVESCGCYLLENRLINEDGNYRIDFIDLETKAANPKTKLLLLSNPHNPVGRVWKKNELERMAEICSKYKVMVVSDEVHSDLVFETHQHISFTSVSANYDLLALTCGSPCKSFNLSGLRVSYIISQNYSLLNKIKKTLEVQETIYPNSIAAAALIAAYTKGKNWLNELKIYLWQNYQYVCSFCKEHLPKIKVTPLQATYLVWLDCRFLNKTSEELSVLLLEKEKVWLNAGTMYGKAGEGFLRLNIACPREQLVKVLKRVENFLNK